MSLRSFQPSVGSRFNVQIIPARAHHPAQPVHLSSTYDVTENHMAKIGKAETRNAKLKSRVRYWNRPNCQSQDLICLLVVTQRRNLTWLIDLRAMLRCAGILELN
jgi:hypothetical protein